MRIFCTFSHFFSTKNNRVYDKAYNALNNWLQVTIRPEQKVETRSDCSAIGACTDCHSLCIFLTHCLLGNFSGFFVVCRIFSKSTFQKILSGIPLECQTVWTLIRPDDLWGLIWIQTVCQDYQQTTLVDKELRCSKVYFF